MAGELYTAKLVFLPSGPFDPCGCHYCNREWHTVMNELDPDGALRRTLSGSFMILCPECGNKRCPKATYHGHNCTHSNDPGQPLSVYGGFVLPGGQESED